jgi:hypothetical protein
MLIWLIVPVILLFHLFMPDVRGFLKNYLHALPQCWRDACREVRDYTKSARALDFPRSQELRKAYKSSRAYFLLLGLWVFNFGE